LVSPGELVRPGTAVIEMYDAATMEVRTQIPAKTLPAIKQALASGKELSAYVLVGDEKIEAVLTRLSGEVARGKSSVDGLFGLSSQTYLELGRAVNLVISLPEVHNTLLVPVQSMYGHNWVFVVNDERLVGITVDRVGELRDKGGQLKVLIRSPEIAPGVPIVTSQLSNAITGLKVTHDDNLSEVANTSTASQGKSS
jgi:hypothetical protein